MQPDQNTNQGQPPSALPQYDFIMNPGSQQKKSKFGMPNGNSTKQRVFIVLGGIGALALIGIIASMLFSGGPSSADNLKILAQQQNEIVRIADAAKNEKTIRNISTQYAATTIGAVVSSEQQQTIALLTKKPNEKTLGLKKSAKTDATLLAASQNNNYDETLLNILKTQLVDYQKQLKVTFDSSKSAKEKAVLDAAYKSSALLLTIPSK